MNTKDIVYIALFAALTAVLGLFPPITLLGGVPITAQSLGPMLAGAILGARRGGLSILLFLVLVAVGLPLLSGGRGGFGVFAGPTGGFLVGYVAAAFVIGFLVEKFWTQMNVFTAALSIATGGILVMYLIGNAWWALVTDFTYLEVTVIAASFLIGDAIKVAIATVVCLAVRRSYPLISKAR